MTSASRILAVPHTPQRPRLHSVWLAAGAIVVLRSLVWVCWEQSDFESDQAIVGLMAKHVAELRAFPLMFYGQHYMLAVESWLAAPLFLVFGASVAALKLPLVAINIVVAVLLLKILTRDAGLSPRHALLASLFFVLPPPITASRLVEAAGTSEPFLYTLLLWVTRAHPIAFGLTAGVGFVHREFTVYAVLAIVLLELWNRSLFTRANLEAKAIVGAETVAIAIVVRWLKGHADLLGPGTAGTFPPDVLNGQVGFWLSRFCWNPAALWPNIKWLFAQNLGTLFGWRVEPLAAFVQSSLTGGHVWAGVALIGLLVSAVCAAIVWRPAATRSIDTPSTGVPAWAFPAYLVIVGLLAIGAYALTSCLVQEPMLIRYTLLALLIPIGVMAAVLRSPGLRLTQWIAVAATAVWAVGSALDNGRVLAEYVHRPPRNEYRAFADFLEREGIWYGRAPYWTAYHIDFLTRERVTLGSFEKVRVSQYEDIVSAHNDESLAVYVDDPCTDEGGVVFGRWCLIYFDRARHRPEGAQPAR